jgi:hypothetical protein
MSGYPTPTYKKTCTWNTTSDVTKGAKYVTLMLEGLDAYQAGKLTGQMKTISVTSISGIGDDAYDLAVGSNVGLIVKKGNVAFKVAVYGDLPIEKKAGYGEDARPASRFQALTCHAKD